MVHLLGDRAHHAGRLHGHSVVHGWRDHCTLVEEVEKKITELMAHLSLNSVWIPVRWRRSAGGGGVSVIKQPQNTGTFLGSMINIAIRLSKSSISAADVSTMLVCAVH